jgi:hypothetical protein
MIWTGLLILWILAELELRLFSHRYVESNIPVWIANMGRQKPRAMTIGRHVLVAPGKLNLVVMAHERAHVDQFRRFTYPGFFLAHLICKLRYGYDENPLEKEAQALARLVADQTLETKGLQR